MIIYSKNTNHNVQVVTEDTHSSTLSSPSLPSLSPAPAKLNDIKPSPAKSSVTTAAKKIETRRESEEGKRLII